MEAMNIMPEKLYAVWVDGVELKSGLNHKDAEDLRRSVAGIVKETTQVATKSIATRETQ